MNLKQIKETIKKQEYDFLKENEYLGNNIILLTLGGSHAYGMDKEDSDLDVRGVALNSKEEILLGKDFEQVVEIDTMSAADNIQGFLIHSLWIYGNSCYRILPDRQ